MTYLAWKNYENFAWGQNELKPISKTGHSAGIFGSSTALGATIVDGLDTIYLMGFMDEYNKGKEWIDKNFNINIVNKNYYIICIFDCIQLKLIFVCRMQKFQHLK